MSVSRYLAGSRRRLRQPRFLAGLLGRFAASCLVLLAVALGALAILDEQRFTAHRAALQELELKQLRAAATVLEQELSRPVTATNALSESYTLRAVLSERSPRNEALAQQNLLVALRYIGIFASASLVGTDGVELMRVEWVDGEYRIAAPSELRDLSGRRDVQRGMTLADGDVYLSRMLLDEENGVLKRPLLPVMRLSSPVLGADGRITGYLLTTYRAGDLLDYFRSVTVDSWGEPMLINRAGYWLYGPNPDETWGFALGRTVTFADRYPEAWRAIHEANSGTALTGEGYFTYATFPEPGLNVGQSLIPRSASMDELQGNYWKLVTRVPPSQYHYSGLSGLSVGPGLAALLAIGVILPSLLLAWLRTSNLAQARELRYNEERLDLALQSTNEGLWDADLRTRRVFYSARWKQVLGYRPDELSDAPGEWGRRLHPDDRDATLALLTQYQAGVDKVGPHRYRLRHRDGHYIWVESHMRVQRDPAGRPVRLVGMTDDISERVAVEERLKQAAAVFENTKEAILIIGPDHRIRAVNPAFTEITGYTPAEAVGRNPKKVIGSGRHGQEFFDELLDTLARQGAWKGEVWERHKEGHVFPVWQNISVVRDSAGRVGHYVAVLTDISALKSSEQRLKELAHTDALTGLPNRLLLMANLEQALTRAERHGQRVALLFLDLDHFKGINDTLGHDAGDLLLREVARRLRECIRAEDTVARLGGDEFTVVLEEVVDAQGVTGPAEKIIEALSRPVALEGRTISTSTSIGISLYPDHASTVPDLMKAADVAMYRAKQSGRGTFRFYSPEMSDVVSRRVAIEQGLRQALAAQELFLCYQPQIDLRSGLLVGVEALLRWRHPRYGVLTPDQFVPVAEETGLIEPIGEWVLATACEQVRRWHGAGAGPLRIAVNLAVRQLASERFLDRLRTALKCLPADAGMQLELEVTESLLQTAEDSIRAFSDLKSLGVRLAIDDFGTGYSSLSSLKHLPIDSLKIDRSFVHDVPTDPDSNAIAQAVVALGHGMRLTVLAEGVEEERQASYLRELGCDEAQGYLYSRPVTAQEIDRRLADGGWFGRATG